MRDQTIATLYWEFVSFRFVIQGFNYTLKSGKDKGKLFVLNYPCFNGRHYIDILITVHVKRLHMSYDNLFMFQSHLMNITQAGVQNWRQD